ncbi:MAG: protein-L-isoaspartate(D-aspartate) O-methyltransferase [Kiritimatiellae bacterium]|nr:protein-L-isoaspartate(D-aspartate) O-methyltransferase [Kiritimatiellia bacterium]
MITWFGRAGAEPQKGGVDEDAGWVSRRQAMVAQLRDYHITNTCVLTAMGKIRRHAFISASYRNVNDAYADAPCPIGRGQTISQPYIVAYMTEKLALKSGDKVLEIGTGSGYQAAVLAECGADVYTIEIIPELARHARAALDAEGFQRVHSLTNDGYKGWPEYSPFNAIIVTCAPDEVPQTLVDQLKEGGRLIAPVGRGFQRLVILRKQHGLVEQEEDLPVCFVPMVRE